MPNDTAPSAGEVRALANKLMSWADQLAVRHESAYDISDADRQKLLIGLAQATLQVRRVRARIFAGKPLSEPVWDVLLKIFGRETAGERVSLETLCQDDDIPRVTVGMCIDLLVESGMIERNAEPGDARTVWLALTEAGRARMQEILLEFLGPPEPGDSA